MIKRDKLNSSNQEYANALIESKLGAICDQVGSMKEKLISGGKI